MARADSSDAAMLPVMFRGHAEAGFFVHGMGFSRHRLLRLLPGNRAIPGDRYACMVPVHNYNHMERAVAAQRGMTHYSEALEPQILEDIRAGRAVLVLDLSNEGPAYHAPIFEPLYDWIEAQRLPRGRVVWLAQNRSMQRAAEASAGARAGLVRFEHYDFFVKWMARNFAKPSAGGRGLATAGLFDPARKDRLLLCLNATPRLQRVLTVAALLHAGLLEESLVSFPGMDYSKQGSSAERVRRFVAANPLLGYLREPVERAMALADLRVDDFAEQGNALADKIDPKPYARSFFSLVTESDISDGGVERVTEKTVKAFCMGHPALVVGNPHSIRFMTGFGFADWDGLIDRGHEAIADPAARFQAVMHETRRQVGLIRDDPGGWLDATRAVSQANLHHAESGGFLARLEADQEAPLAERLAGLVGIA